MPPPLNTPLHGYLNVEDISSIHGNMKCSKIHASSIFIEKAQGVGGKQPSAPLPLFPPLCMEHYIEKIEFVCCGGFVTVWLWLLCMYTNSILRKHRFQWKRNKIWKCVRSGDQGFRCADVKKCGTLHDFACHPCAGAMLIFSVSFQF